MKDNEIFLPQYIYLNQLNSINGIKFSQREIDIIAFLMHGRTTKIIANFYSLSPRTIENYIHNIMLKLGCNSRQSIIDFVEKSNKVPSLKNYYKSLIVHSYFEEKTKKIYAQLQEKPICTLYGTKTSVVKQSIQHLESIGLKLFFQKETSVKFLENLDLENLTLKDGYTLLFLSSDDINKISLNHLESNQNIIEKISKNEKLVPIYLEEENQVEIPAVLQNEHDLITLSYKNYYKAFFTILKSIVPNINVKDVYQELEEYILKSIPIADSNFIESVKSPFFIFQALQNQRQLWNQSTVFTSKRIGLMCIFILILSGFLYRHYYERAELLKEFNEIKTSWVHVYKNHVNDAISHASFFQLRVNILNIPQVQKIKSEITKVATILEKDIKLTKDKKRNFNMQYLVVSPFNWQLKKKLDLKLLNKEKKLLIALSFIKASQFLSHDNFTEVLKEITLNTIPLINNELKNKSISERKKKILNKWKAIAVNLSSGVAKRKLADAKIIDKKLYKKAYQEIIQDLLWSVKHLDSDNFSTLITLHYLILECAKREVNQLEKTHFESEAKKYLKLASDKAPKDARVLFEQAHQYKYEGEFNRALLTYNTAIILEPDNIGMLYQRAEAYIKMGEEKSKLDYYKLAFNDMQKADNLKPNDCDLLNLLVWSSIYVEGCKKASHRFYSIYKPLCGSGKESWDDTSAIRDDDIEKIWKKLSNKCPALNLQIQN